MFHQVQDTLAENPNIHYYYQSDYKGYYDSIDHDILISTIRRYVGDPVLLPILENFVKALYPNGKHGISKGLRSSQFFGNLYHNDIDHRMIDEYGAKLTSVFVMTSLFSVRVNVICGNCGTNYTMKQLK